MEIQAVPEIPGPTVKAGVKWHIPGQDEFLEAKPCLLELGQ